jgi:PAS domain S-box-containing protein
MNRAKGRSGGILNPSGGTILIVDDEPANLAVVADYLANSGFQVKVALTGETGLELARQVPPDLILLDVRLPGIDGFEVCRCLKADERTRAVPVIFMTIVNNMEEKIKGFDAGGVDYITKPFQEEELLARVRTHLHLRELTEQLEQKVAERTEELNTANALLQRELAKRKTTDEELRRSEKYKEIQNQIANIFLTISDEDVYKEVLVVVLQAMKSKLGLFGFINADGDLVIPNMTREIWNECRVPDRSMVFPQSTWGRSLWGRAIMEKRSFFSNGPFHTPEGHVHIDSFLTVPIISGGETVGILSMADKEKGYTEKDRDLLESIAGYISPILNARLQNDRKEQERKMTEHALKESEALFRAAFENATVGICMVGMDGRFLNSNRKLFEILGYTNAELGRLRFNDITHDEDKDLGAMLVKQAVAGEINNINFEKRYLHKNGRIVWAHVSSTIIRNLAGEAQFFFSHIQDISLRKQVEEKFYKLNRKLEQRVRQRTAELEKVNKELEAFAYSVSHDLRTPLRHIDGFIELLQKKLGNAQDKQARHYMDAISEAAAKMGLLIDDFLSFSRVNRQTMEFRPVVLNPLVRDVIGELEHDTTGRTIHWRIDDLPVVSGHAAMLRIVLANLIENAVKFTRPREKARIEIGSLPGRNSEAVIFVRDNGVGFDMAYGDKLFGVFQRLHRTDEFEGTGIGLANVRRIITRHGGRTWAEGVPDRGATFYFTLPQVKGDLSIKQESV